MAAFFVAKIKNYIPFIINPDRISTHILIENSEVKNEQHKNQIWRSKW